MIIHDGLYRNKNRVIDNLIEIRLLTYSDNKVAVKFSMTYGDYYMKSQVIESWLKVQDFEKTFEFVDSFPT